jgi:hypothetical protein
LGKEQKHLLKRIYCDLTMALSTEVFDNVKAKFVSVAEIYDNVSSNHLSGMEELIVLCILTYANNPTLIK